MHTKQNKQALDAKAYIEKVANTINDICMSGDSPEVAREKLAKLLPEAERPMLNAKARTALIVVDVQNDFTKGGSLAVPKGESVVAKMNALMPKFDVVVATQDWHPKDHGSFASNHPGKNLFDQVDLNGLPQTLWPDHCVQGTPGAEFHPDLNLRGIDKVFPKGTDAGIDSYSGFYDNGHRRSTGLGEYLKARGVKEVYVAGLATDYCVKFTALDAARDGFDTHFIEDASKGVNIQPTDVQNAINEMKQAGIHVTTSRSINPAKTKSPDCGTGAGGFKPGNTCGVKNSFVALTDTLKNAGEPCGESFIAPDKTCHVGESGGRAKALALPEETRNRLADKMYELGRKKADLSQGSWGGKWNAIDTIENNVEAELSKLGVIPMFKGEGEMEDAKEELQLLGYRRAIERGDWDQERARPTRVTVEKQNPAYKAHGRGMDNYTQPASYVVKHEGDTIASIRTGRRGYMSGTEWSVNAIHPSDPNREKQVGLTHKTLEQAKVFAKKNAQRIRDAWTDKTTE